MKYDCFAFDYKKKVIFPQGVPKTSDFNTMSVVDKAHSGSS